MSREAALKVILAALLKKSFGAVGPKKPAKFKNGFPDQLSIELVQAEAVGFQAVVPGSSAFANAANSGRLKWVVKADGELVVGPKFLKGQEISHTVLSKGGEVIAAGEAEISIVGKTKFGVEINNHSGHYRPSSESLSHGVEAFKEVGIEFTIKETR